LNGRNDLLAAIRSRRISALTKDETTYMESDDSSTSTPKPISHNKNALLSDIRSLEKNEKSQQTSNNGSGFDERNNLLAAIRSRAVDRTSEDTQMITAQNQVSALGKDQFIAANQTFNMTEVQPAMNGTTTIVTKTGTEFSSTGTT
jgi:hypothetical protein